MIDQALVGPALGPRVDLLFKREREGDVRVHLLFKRERKKREKGV